MRRKYKLFLAMFLILAMLLQAHAVYATEGRKEIPNSSLSGVLPAEKTEASVETSANMGNIFGLENGKSYYIMNVGTGTILGVRSLNDADGNRICMRDRQELTNRQWKVSVCENDTGILQWNDSSTNKVMTFSNGEFVLSSNVNDPISQVFMIDRIEAGQYQGLYRIRLNYHYLALSSNSRAYPQLTTTFDAYSVWSFMEVDKDFSDIFSFTYTDYDSSANDGNFVLLFDTLGYLSGAWNNFSASDAYNLMQNDSNVWIFRGHGNPGCIGFRIDASGTHGGQIRAGSSTALNTSAGYYLSTLSDNVLASSRCIMYIGCKTGLTSSEGYNLLDQTFEKGASFVLGTEEEVYPDDSNKFLLGFLQGVAESKNIRDCVIKGIATVGSDSDYEGNEYPAIAVGDQYQFLNFTPQTITFDTEDILK